MVSGNYLDFFRRPSTKRNETDREYFYLDVSHLRMCGTAKADKLCFAQITGFTSRKHLFRTYYDR